MDDLGNFLQQQGIMTILAVVIGLGIVYVVLTLYIIRRGAARRKKKREEALAAGGFVTAAPQQQMADKPAEWAMPAELRQIPEPDLDLLASPYLGDALTEQADEGVPAADSVLASVLDSAADSTVATVVPIDTEPAATNSQWITAVVPAQETAMTSTNTDNSADSQIPEMQLGDAVEVMRIWRDLSDGRLIIQMGNQRYRSLTDIQNPDLTRRFVAVVRDLWAMINGGTAPRVEPLPPGNTASGLKSRMGLLNGEQEEPMPNMFKQVIRPLNQPAKPAASEPAPGIANSVEDFLQYRLSNTPDLSMRSIHIRTAHDHGITIEVDGHYYDAIGDVVDADVREFLFNLMREWEARH